MTYRPNRLESHGPGVARALLLRPGMKHGIALALVCTMVGTAQAGPADALDHVRDAIDLVDEEGGKCKKDVMEDLKEIKSLLKDEDFSRASKRLRSVRKDADRCHAKVEKLLNRAYRELDGNDDRKDAPAAPAAIAGIPYAEWHQDCRDSWLITEVARHHAAETTLAKMGVMFRPACDSPNGMPAANYPNGTMAKSANGDWYYPNGTMAKSSSGAFYYPNGTMARSASNNWYYPNGTMAYGSSTWYYKNGTNAGGYEALASQACARSDAACKVYKHAMQSNVDDWRSYAVVQLESRAK
jgi:hypothetical protein